MFAPEAPSGPLHSADEPPDFLQLPEPIKQRRLASFGHGILILRLWNLVIHGTFMEPKYTIHEQLDSTLAISFQCGTSGTRHGKAVKCRCLIMMNVHDERSCMKSPLHVPRVLCVVSNTKWPCYATIQGTLKQLGSIPLLGISDWDEGMTQTRTTSYLIHSRGKFCISVAFEVM
jgi:hypothetical protein